MSPTENETINSFNKYVNMTASELETWLEGPECHTAGTGVGIESGHKIMSILRKNPKKQASKYDDNDLAHMRKVNAYCKRHLAQENKLKDTKTPEELEHTKSTISLKNWGHDPMKTLDDHIENANDQSDLEQEEEEEDVEEEKHMKPSKTKKSKSAGKRSHEEAAKSEDEKTPSSDSVQDEKGSQEDQEEGQEEKEGNKEVEEQPKKKRTKGTKEGVRTVNTRSMSKAK